VFNVGPTELLVVLLIALIVFGPKRLPEVGRTVGKGLREFRRATDEIRGEIQSTMEDDEPAEPQKDGQPTTADAPPAVTTTDAPSASTSDEAPAEVAASEVHAAQPGTGDTPNPDGATPVA
jgi:sec-independent protein translocase protein TatA